MQNILLGFALSLVLTASAWSAPEVKAHEKKISSAKEWSDISAHLRGKLPSNVVREFADFAKGVPFPASRRIKNTLVLTQNDGTKVSVIFKKDGAISLNGKEWKLRPLATVEEEVTRLALFLSGEKKADAGFFGFVPAAQAGGAGGMGVAAAAYAGANAWKAEACGEDELSEDLVNDCPVMAVGMKPVLVASKSTSNKSLPVDLRCPKENRGTFQMVFRDKVGSSQRYQILFNGSQAKKILIDVSKQGESYRNDFLIDFSEDNRSEDVQVAQRIMKMMTPVLEKVCDGSQKERERFQAFLDSNRDETKVLKSNFNGADDKSSVEAL